MATPLTAVPIPALTDVPNAPAQLLTAFAWAEKFFNLRFATTVARDAAIPTPDIGMVSYVTADGFPSYWNGTRWVPYVTDTVNAADIAAGVITNEMLDTTAGQLGGAWNTYTPTWTNVNQTGSTRSGRYMQIGKTVVFVSRFTLGSGSSVSGSPTTTLPPITAASGLGGASVGRAGMYDSDANLFYVGFVLFPNTTTASANVIATSAAYAVAGAASASVPFVWTTGDFVEISGIYEAA